jgi:microcystin-dependent protein
MAKNVFSPYDVIESAKINANFDGAYDGSFDTDANSITVFRNESFPDFVVPGGLVWSLISALNGTMTGGTVYTNGVRITVSSIVTKAFTASKDTYVDVNTSGTVVYTEVANGATTGMTLSAGFVRIAKIVTSGVAITSIVQGGVDPLGNLIYNLSPTATGITGEIKIWSTLIAPAGWIICDGSAVSRTTYFVLFSCIGTTYGSGDGSTTFNLPNLKGRTPVGVGLATANGATTHTLAQVGGEETHTLTSAELAAHSHGIKIDNTNGVPSAGASEVSPGPAVAYSRNLFTLDAGSNNAHNTMQPYLGLQFIIKA